MLEAALSRAERRAKIELNRAVLRLVNGIGWLIGDPSSAVGHTPYDVIYRDGKMTVHRYRAPVTSRHRRYPLPVLMIPPLMWNREYVKGFDAMNEWVGQLVDYPQQAFLQFSREFVRKNKFVKGRMRFGDKVADLKRVESSLLVFAGRSDRLAPAKAVRAILTAVGSVDKEFHVVPGGHMGVFAGRGAPEHVWTRVAEWLAPRSQRRPAQAGAAAGSGARSPMRKQRSSGESHG